MLPLWQALEDLVQSLSAPQTNPPAVDDMGRSHLSEEGWRSEGCNQGATVRKKTG